MRYTVGFAVAALIVLSGCDNTMYGVGQDMQHAGSALSEQATPSPPPLGPVYRDRQDDEPLVQDGYPPYRSPQ